MAYHETKVYFDGSHYIAIPHTETPRKPRKYKPPPADPATIKRPTEVSLDVTNLFQECEPAEHVFDAKPTDQHELSDRKGGACSTKQHELPDRKSDANLTKQHELLDRVPNKKPTEKEIFNEVYAKHMNTPKRERKKAILEEMKPYFDNDREAELFVDANMTRKNNNLIARRIRMIRKVNLQEFNYFVTFTYSDALHTEESFKKKLRGTLNVNACRKGWKYVGVWERSPEKQRLHFHGLFYFPEGTLPGEMKEVKYYSFSEHKVNVSLQNTYFLERFGINVFTPLEDRAQIGPVLSYIVKYIEKSGEKIVYSRGLPQFFISDILEDDVVCRIGLEDKKLLLFDNFSCFDEGCYVGPVSKETIKLLRKSN